MAASPLPRLSLFARLPDGLSDALAVSNDVMPALPGLRLIPAARRHITLADLEATGVAQDHVVAMIGWIMATMPPFAFPVLFDRIVTSARHTLLKASEPLSGALACQAHIVETARHYGLDLPRTAMPVPHVTLGYAHRATPGVRPIGAIGWRVDELVLVRRWQGRSWHEELGRWHLPDHRKVA